MIKQNQAKVCIGIVSFNSYKDLLLCIPAIQQQSYSNWEILIWDNASIDETQEYLGKALEKNSYFHNSNIGFAKAHNQLIKHAKALAADYYLALNPDSCLAPDYIEVLVDFLETKPSAGWVSGKLLRPNGQVYSLGHALRSDAYAYNIAYGLENYQNDEAREVFGVPAAAALYSMKMINDIIQTTGEFYDEDYFLYYEDVDLDWRARRLGWLCYSVPTAIGLHEGSRPEEILRIKAIMQRIASAIKNSYPMDFPHILLISSLHILFRLIFSSKYFPQIWTDLKYLIARAWRKRYQPRVDRAYIQAWFTWEKNQTSSSPRSLWERLMSFWNLSF
jgi:GT2 family glycosyltransferase